MSSRHHDVALSDASVVDVLDAVVALTDDEASCVARGESVDLVGLLESNAWGWFLTRGEWQKCSTYTRGARYSGAVFWLLLRRARG